MLDYENNTIPIRALVVDDEKPIIEMLDSILSTFGIQEIYIAYNGEEGLNMFNKHSPDIVITDYYMPIMDGVELYKAIKIARPEIPVIFFTGQEKKVAARLEIDGLKPDYIVSKVFLRIEMIADIFKECFPDYNFTELKFS